MAARPRRTLPALGAFLLIIATGSGAAAVAPLHGVVEGYYGRPWTAAARQDVLRFLGTHGMNTFVYGPKNDPYHRDRWREPYPNDAAAALRATARVAAAARVQFIVAVSPGLDLCYTCATDTRALRQKLRQLVRNRIRRFALFFDDAPAALSHPEDLARFGGTDAAALGRAQAEVVRRTDAWLRRRGLPVLTLIVPTEYQGTICTAYSAALDDGLPRGIAVGWTGTAVVSETVSAADAAARRTCYGTRRLVLWDNFPVNDTILSSNLHLGPLTGRGPDLGPALGGGHLLNPMTQAHASLVALGTAAAYFRDPTGYDPEAAWRSTLLELAPAGTLDVLAEQTRSSGLALDDARPLAALLDALDTAYDTANWTATVAALASEEDRERSAADAITGTLGGTALGDEIAPWVAELRAHSGEALDVVALLRAMKPSLEGVTVANGHLTGRALYPDTTAVGLLGPPVAGRPPAPTLPALLDCLGPLLSADIRFCPQLGLNVHGKQLYMQLGASISLVTGRNQHARLLALAAARYVAWLGRRGPTPGLTLTVDGGPVPVAGDGTFDALVGPEGTARLVVATEAGEATAMDLP